MADITYSTLSNATTAINGTGNFDKLVQVVTLHLEAQFTAGRITGTDYATVYLGALQSTLDQAVKFTLNMNKSNADVNLVGKQEDLVDKQILTEVKQTLDVEESTSLKSKQGLKIDAEELKADAETALLGKKGATEDKQLLVMAEQIDLFVEQAKGFKWNADAKYLKTVLDAYAINLSVGKSYDATTKPAVGGHVTNAGTLDHTSKAGDYVVKLKPS